jgi:hypothetical protein
MASFFLTTRTLVACMSMWHLQRQTCTHLLVPLGWEQLAPLSTGGAYMTYVSSFVPVPLLHAPLQGPVVSHVALQATGLHALVLVQGVTNRVSLLLARQFVPFLAAGVVIIYLQDTGM